MKKSFRIIAVMALASVLTLLTACNPADKLYGVSSEDNSQADNSTKNVEIEHPKILSSDKVMPQFVDISLYDEENYAGIYLGKKFKIDASYEGCDFKVPCTFSEVTANGWNLEETSEYDTNSLIYAGDYIDMVLVNQNGKKIDATFYNSSNSSQKVSECYIVKFHINNTFYNKATDYGTFNIDGITNTSVVTDIIDTLGSPSHFYAVSDTEYYLDYFISKDDRRNGITVYINTVDDSVTAIEFSYYK